MGYYNNYMQPYMQPQYTQQYQPQAQMPQPQQTNNGLIWVASEAEAQNYLVAPNNAVALWDSNASAVYLKQADAAGRPSFKVFDLVERGLKPTVAPENYVTRKEFEALAAKIDAMSKEATE